MAEAEKELAHLEKIAPELRSLVTIIRDKEELKKHRVSPEAVGATLSQGAASLWPYKLITFILERLVKAGQLNLQTNTAVKEITSTNNRHTLHTERGDISAKSVILATNGYTSALLPHFADLVVPVRGEMSALIPPRGNTILPDSHGMVAALGQAANNDDYLVQRPFEGVPNPGGHLMFGGGRGAGHLPTIGVSDDSIIDEDSAAYLRGALLKVLQLDGATEGLKELEAAGQWTGIMGYSAYTSVLLLLLQLMGDRPRQPPLGRPSTRPEGTLAFGRIYRSRNAQYYVMRCRSRGDVAWGRGRPGSRRTTNANGTKRRHSKQLHPHKGENRES